MTAKNKSQVISNLQMLSAGEYLYDGHYRICKTPVHKTVDTAWTVYKEDGRFYLNAPTLTSAVRRLKAVLLYEQEREAAT